MQLLIFRLYITLQIFFTFFKTLEGKFVVVELKNDLQIRGTLMSVDQYLNLKLGNVEVIEKEKHPQLVSICICTGTLLMML